MLMTASELSCVVKTDLPVISIILILYERLFLLPKCIISLSLVGLGYTFISSGIDLMFCVDKFNASLKVICAEFNILLLKIAVSYSCTKPINLKWSVLYKVG